MTIPMENEPKPDMLRSWKEISAYLGYDERTCYRWEHKYGMPVHRAAGSKSHVVAYKGELDHWFRTTFKNSSHQPPPGPPKPADAPSGRPSRKWLIFGFVLVVAALAATLIRPSKGPGEQPNDFAIRGSTLIILAEDKREIWRHDTKVEGLQDEEHYRARFQVVDASRCEDRLPIIVIKDINGDGRTEVLFAVQKRDNAYGEGDLYCYDDRGTELWHFAAGRETSFGGRTYSADYRIFGLAVHDCDKDGRPEIAVVSHQYPQWPCQLAVLDCNGRQTGEFWNSGQIKDIGFADINGDGRDEMLAAGVNNEYGPCLAVFDPSRVSGCSPQDGEFKADSLGPGSEISYFSFPRTDVSLASGAIVQSISQLGVNADKTITANDDLNVFYHLDFGLRCLYVDWGHGFMVKHKELRAAGKIRSNLGPAYAEILKRGIRYWNGRAWAASPAPNAINLRARAAVDGRTP